METAWMGATEVETHGVPSGAQGKWIVFRATRGGLWFWGAYDSYELACVHALEAGPHTVISGPGWEARA